MISLSQCVLLVVIAALAAIAQQPAPPQPLREEKPGFVIRTETSLALVRFHVVRKNKYVEDLRPEDIQVLEDGVPQKLALLEGPRTPGRTVPVEIILLFDVSLSVMNENLLDTFAIKEAFLDGMGDHVSVSVYAFGAKLKRFCTPTRDVQKLKTALDGVFKFTHPGTRLYEAIMQTAKDASESKTNATRLMVIFSDGLSTTKTPPANAARVAAFFGVPLYPVVLGHERVMKQAMAGGGGGDRIPQNLGGNQGPRILDPGSLQRQAAAREKEAQMVEYAEIGGATGGRSYDPPLVNSRIVRTILQSVAKQVQAEYVAGYYLPPSGETKRPHQVQVALARKDAGKIYGGARLVVH